MSTSPRTARRLQSIAPTIFAEMSALALQTGSLNLGQGFPDEDGPSPVVEAAVEALRTGHNQYAPGRGVPELREAVAAHQQRHYGSSSTRPPRSSSPPAPPRESLPRSSRS